MSESWVIDDDNAIAIVGMAGRFPGAENVEEFWRSLRDGVESVVFFEDDELVEAGVGAETRHHEHYVPARAPLEGVEFFDAALFGISPREAEMMDPQQRVFLECALETLESAGYDSLRYRGAIGIFGGSNTNTYLGNLYDNPERVQAFGVYNTVLANDKDYLTTRVAYKLNLQGPAVTVQTACSTSLVAVHLACQSLLSGESDLALAGGVALNLPERSGYLWEPHGISSPDGHCRAFDARSAGTVSGSGVGLVALRKLTTARAEGDSILAVLRSTAINNDGASKVSYSAPSVRAQAQVVAEALAVANVDPGSIGFVEAHGTGTSLGDPVEVAALTRAFRRHTSRRGYCALGSTKTNIGHLDAAAGIAGLIKTIQALRHGEVPPTLHFEAANPQIDFAGSPFFVNNQRIDWPLDARPRRAGITSLGIGGTNAHAVLEEAPPAPGSGPSRETQVVVLSANSAQALEAVTDRIASYLREHPDVPLADVAFTLQVGRTIRPHRRTLLARDARQAAKSLANRSPNLDSRACEARERPVCFLFSGQGSQYPGMGHDLYRSESAFRERIDRCHDILAKTAGFDLRQVMFGAENEDRRGDGASDLTATALAQPALFSLEYALAQQWMDWGVTPQAMLGHSIGEYVAACLAGVFTLEEALALVATRGRLMDALPTGSMSAVPLGPEALGERLPEELDLAVVNAPQMCVVAGPTAALAAFEEVLAADGIECRRLHTSHAFHSRAMDSILEEFEEEVRRVGPRPGKLPFLSNLTGTWQTDEDSADPTYWARHLRQTVLFGPALGLLLEEPEAVLLEIGPGDALATTARRHPRRAAERPILASLPHAHSRAGDEEVILGTLAQLWLAGVAIDWEGFYRHEQRRRRALPAYPFERQRFWVERLAAADGKSSPDLLQEEANAGDPQARNEEIDDWLFRPEWMRSPLSNRPIARESAKRWLLVLDDFGIGEEIAQRLTVDGCEVLNARQGEWESGGDAGNFRLDFTRQDHCVRLVDELAAADLLPDRLVHLRSLSGLDSPTSPQHEVPHLYDLLYLAEAFGRRSAAHPVNISVITDRTRAVGGDEVLDPGKAALLGPVRVVPQEYPDIGCRLIDVSLPPTEPELSLLTERLFAELLRENEISSVAWRGATRWVETFQPWSLDNGGEDRADEESAALRLEGVYLITGGLGQIGSALANDLARTVKAKLVLLTRSPLPPRDGWDGWLADNGAAEPTSRKLLSLIALEECGAEVLPLAVDVGDRTALAEAVAQARARFGTIHGVFHAAGSSDGGAMRPIQDLDFASCPALFRPKLAALAALAEVFREEPPDFLVAFSSLATVLGGLGHAVYAAANAAMTACAHEITRTSRVPCLVIDWDAWRFDDGRPDTGIGARLSKLALSPAEGIAALKRILDLRAGPRVIVSTSDLQARIDEWVRLLALHGPTDADGAARHARPGLTTPYLAPRNELEEVLVELWQELLGLEQVGVHDNFFALGGHSLLGIQINARLRRTFEIDIPLSDLFDNPTVAELAEVLEEALIGDLEDLSDEEAETLLAKESEESQSGSPDDADFEGNK